MTLKTIENSRRALKQGGLKMLVYAGIPPEELTTPETPPLVTLPLEHKPSYDLHEIAFDKTKATIETAGEPTYFHIVSQDEDVILRGDVGPDLFIDHRTLPQHNQLTVYGVSIVIPNDADSHS